MNTNELSDIAAIERTITLYSHLCDFGRLEEFGDLFTEDALFSTLVPEGEVPTPKGPAEIVAHVRSNIARLAEQGTQLLHMPGKPVIELAGDSALAWWTFSVLAAGKDGNSVVSAGRYHAELVRSEDSYWRFKNRVCVVSGARLPEGRLAEPPAH